MAALDALSSDDGQVEVASENGAVPGTFTEVRRILESAAELQQLQN